MTGEAGFIGSNLAQELVRENEVVIFDDMSTGSISYVFYHTTISSEARFGYESL